MTEPGEPGAWRDAWEMHARFLRAVQDAAASDEVRPEVVQAICDLTMDMLSGPDVAKIEAKIEANMRLLAEKRITPAEREHADDLILATMAAEADHRDREAEVWHVLIARQWSSPPSWEQLFDDLTPERAEQLRDLYDALPDAARAEFDKRFGPPWD